MDRRLSALEILYQRRDGTPPRPPVDWFAVMREIPDAFAGLSDAERHEYVALMARTAYVPGYDSRRDVPAAWQRLAALDDRIVWPDWFFDQPGAAIDTEDRR